MIALEPNPVADIALVAGLISAGAFFLRDKLLSSSEGASNPSTAAISLEDDMGDEMERGVLGLRALDRPEEIVPTTMSTVPRAGTPSTVPVAVGDFMMDLDDASGGKPVSPRLAEELAWACGQVLDCGAGGVAVFNDKGALIWSDGRLVEEPLGDGGDLVQRVRERKEKVVCDCQRGASELPSCFSSDVVNIACLPVGEDGTVLTVASTEEGFYNTMQDRVCSAVCSRLQMFVFTDSFRNSQF